MEFCPEDINESIKAVVGEMNWRSENRAKVTRDRRAGPRRPACEECALWVFNHSGKKKVASVVIRNSSFCGISVVAKLSRSLWVGQPVEAIMLDPYGLPRHVAGIIAFCRNLNDGYHELGIEVKAVGSHEILMDETDDPATRYTWFAEALRALKEETGAQASG